MLKNFNKPLKNKNKKSWLEKFKKKTKKTFNNLKNFFKKDETKKIFLKKLKNTFLSSDTGVKTTNFLISKLKKKITKKKKIYNELQKLLTKILTPIEKKFSLNKKKPLIITIIGINGVGKTSVVGKLAKFILDNKQTVLLASCDTFRAGAYEQLKFFGDLNKIKTIFQKSSNPSAIANNAIESAKSKKIDNVIIDTAGRLPNQKYLMEELKKLKRTIENKINTHSHEILLVLDINNGQNILSQIKKFHKELKITGLIITKFDSSSKGGIIISIAKNQKIPIYFITTGEKIENIQEFKIINYLNTLLS
ncbi:signal recognition particle receptor subunit alpha [Candidatus Zinderia endosymbiont of Aphrophora alni]|uniref:nucleotide-binding protein n=1 Tax=Candidatus Zinderia endosymbiont of Aphrophora alni TaxID=3077951 RepID=UPI0030D3818D